MSSGATPPLNDCGCCEGVQDETPVDIGNVAGLAALAYRVGTQSRFKQSMQVDLTRHGALLDLKTRRDEDPTIGLLDAWACVLDVLTFYQERIANEGYLRTGTERRSLLELARSIGYELRPGVAASTYLMFTMEDAAGAPREAIVSTGTQAQSIPGQDEDPQTFETIEEIKARPAWNELRPRATQLQELAIKDGKQVHKRAEVGFLYLKGTNAGLMPGDLLLITTGAGATTTTVSRRVARVIVDDELKRTRVELETSVAIAEQLSTPAAAVLFDAIHFPPNIPPLPFNDANVEAEVLTKRLRETDLQTLLEVNRWNADDLTEFVAKRNATQTVPHEAVYAFRERCGFFGNNAPPFASLRDKNGGPLFDPDWDAEGWPIWNAYPAQSSTITQTPSSGTSARIATQFSVATKQFDFGTGTYKARAGDPCLERSVPGIVQNSWAVFSNGGTARIYRVIQARESSVVGFGMSGKTTVLTLRDPDRGNVTRPEFLVRNTTAWIKSEPLELAALPVSDFISATTTALELDEMILGLRPGQLVVLSGEQRDAPGIIRQELLALHEIIHRDGRTTLQFREESAGAGLVYSYWRKTVTLNANVARATQGETKREVLGSGEAAQAFQKFALKQAPLTYVSAPTPAGIASTLQLRVNEVLWDEAPTLYRRPPSDRIYVTRRSDEGTTTAQFGDGVTGARLPSGIENIVATYRVGIGLGGLVKASQISLLMTRSLGLKDVTNPLPATGAADAETREEARENAPFTVLTLDRIVSLQDFEDFARAYPGIGKAQATWLWQGEHKLIHITVAGADGRPISTVSALYKNLILSMERARDPGHHVVVASFVPIFFNVQAKLLVARGYLAEKVRAAAIATLVSAFSFPRRAFGQAVTKGEVYSVIQGVEGVDAVDVDRLYLSPNPATLENRLPVRTAGWDQANTMVDAAELLLVNSREIQLTEMPA